MMQSGDMPMMDAPEEDGGSNNMGNMESTNMQRDNGVKKIKMGENEYVLLPIKVQGEAKESPPKVKSEQDYIKAICGQ